MPFGPDPDQASTDPAGSARTPTRTLKVPTGLTEVPAQPPKVIQIVDGRPLADWMVPVDGNAMTRWLPTPEADAVAVAMPPEGRSQRSPSAPVLCIRDHAGAGLADQDRRVGGLSPRPGTLTRPHYESAL